MIGQNLSDEAGLWLLKYSNSSMDRFLKVGTASRVIAFHLNLEFFLSY
jgi:hypothetical protein